MVVPNEIALMHRLSPFPHIIRLIEWFEKPDSYIIIMERPDPCLDLFDYITEQKSLSEDTARTFFWQVRQKKFLLLFYHFASFLYRPGLRSIFHASFLWFVTFSAVVLS